MLLHEMLAKLNPGQLENVAKLTAEMIIELQKIDDCECLIDACSSALELAEFYPKCKAIMNFHKVSTKDYALEGLRGSITIYAGIPDEYTDYKFLKSVGRVDSILNLTLERYGE